MKRMILTVALLGIALVPTIAGADENYQRLEVERIQVMQPSEYWLPPLRNAGTRPSAVPTSAPMPRQPAYQQQPAYRQQPVYQQQPVPPTPEPVVTHQSPARQPAQRVYAPAPAASVTPARLQYQQFSYPSQHAFSPAEYFYDQHHLYFDYGGWYFLNIRNANNTDHSFQAIDGTKYSVDNDLRLYGKVMSESGNRGYLRIRTTYTHLEQDEPNYAGIGSDLAGPRIDMAYVDWKCPVPGILYRKRHERLNLVAGRQFFMVGRGIALAGREDALRLLYRTPDWNWRLFIARSVPGTDNIDLTVPGWGRSAHNFYGAEAQYLGVDDQKFYAYMMWVRDSSREYPNNDFQEYDYDPAYFGIGAEGQAVPNLKYWAEYILQRGKSYTAATEQQREQIRANALDIGLRYFFPDITGNPSLTAEYMQSTGDEDRAIVVGTAGGNTALSPNNTGSKDNAFQYFGYVPLGYAWSPRLTNLAVYKFAASLQPLKLLQYDNDATLTLTYYNFNLKQPESVISDLAFVPLRFAPFPTTQQGTDLGDEIDLSFYWKLVSDIQVNINYGTFRPGQAFLDGARDRSRYLAVGMMHSF